LFKKPTERNCLVRNYLTHLSLQQEGEEGDTTAQQLLLDLLLLLQELKCTLKHHSPRWNLLVNLLAVRNSPLLGGFLSHRLLSSSNHLFNHNSLWQSVNILRLSQLLKPCHLPKDPCKPLYNSLDWANASPQHACHFHRRPHPDLPARSHESNDPWPPHSHCSRLETRLL
jgi:hypothetical protein